MKIILFILTAALLQLNVFAQNSYPEIKISDNVKLIRIADNAYVHVSYADLPQYGRTPANGLLLVNGNEAFLFDSPWTDSETKDLLNWITDSMKIKVVGFVPTHWHVDCMGGLGYIQNQKIDSYANQMTIDIARNKNLPVPDHGFKDSLQLMLGDKSINCYYLGAAHSMDNIVVWIPSEKILFAGCMIKNVNARNLGNTADGDLKAYPGTIEKVLAKFPDAEIVIPGHGNFGGMELVGHTKELADTFKE